jgi:alpha-L-rhamnosidase
MNLFARLSLFVACLFVIQAPSLSAQSNSSLHVTDLTCEYLVNPLGIDADQPRLSWKLDAVDSTSRGLYQTAYQVLVASTNDLLERHAGDLWDSGVVHTPQSTLVEYQGSALASQAICYWKVRVLDQAGQWSDWSQTAFWTMGLLKESDWQAEWIGTNMAFERKEGWPPPDNANPDPWFRKEFDLEGSAQSAFMYVASFGYHELHVNGHKVHDSVLMPSVSNLRTRARYVTYDIQPYLKKGKNVVGLWLGASWSMFPPYQTEDKPAVPMVIGQADIHLSDDKIVSVVTDDTWKMHESPNTTIGVWDFMHFGGELYDARKEMSLWSQHILDDSDWEPATVYHPQFTLSAEMVEPNRVVTEVIPIEVKQISDDEYVIDLGVNFAGLFEMKLRGKPGQRIEMQFSEREGIPMTHRHRSVYILGPSGEGTFKNRFNYFSGRWVHVKGLAYKPRLEEIRGYLVRTDFARAGQFYCSDPLLTQIYNTTLWTFESLALGGYVVDCPQRERMGYGGDAHATTLCGLLNYNSGAFYTKWSEDWRDTQDSTGNLPYTAPTYWGGGGPAWSGYCVTLPWDLYHQYNDKRILEINFPTIQRWLSFLEGKSKDNMLVRWGGEWDFLGDWLWPQAQGTNGDTVETLFLNNCYWIYNLQTAAKIADVLNKPEAAEAYRARADVIRETVHAKFFNAKDNSYVNAFQGYLAVALLVNLPPEPLRPKVWERLETEILLTRDGHIHAGITAGALLFKTLLDFDRQDLIYSMATKETYPSWGHMLKQGATTIWEDWEGRSNHSLLHSSYLYIGPWFIEGLGGIKIDPDASGYQQFKIKPFVPHYGNVNRVFSSYDSLYGRIASNWRVTEGVFQLEAVVPPNTSATVYLPGSHIDRVKESGKPLDEAKNIRILETREDAILLEVGSGTYTFECR